MAPITTTTMPIVQMMATFATNPMMSKITPRIGVGEPSPDGYEMTFASPTC